MDWFLDKGIWIIVAAIVPVAGYLMLRLVLRRVFVRLAGRIGRLPLLDSLTENGQAFSRFVEIVLGLALTCGAVLAILAVLDINIEPATSRLEGFGLDAARWVGTHGLRVLTIAVFAWLIVRNTSRVISPVLRMSLTRDKNGVELEEASKRANALVQVGVYAVTAVVSLTAGIMVLSEFGFNLAPLIAGVGIVGIALGFGSQHLVRDLISGVFILVEDQYRVGDVASVGGKTGLVEGVNLRRTVLRDLDGIVHSIPNGEITTASNYTKSFSRVNLDVSVAYKEDLDRVIRVLNRVGLGLARDDYYGDIIIEPPQVLRVDSFGESGIEIKVLGVTKPIRQWEVMGELRRRIKREFDREGIEIPYPHRTVYWGVGSHPGLDPSPGNRAAAAGPVQDPAPEPDRLPDPWAFEQGELGANSRGLGDGREEGKLDNVMAHLDEVRILVREPSLALFTDIDGTLAPITSAPRLAKISPAVRQALNVLSRRMVVVISTGRDLAAARSVVGLTTVNYHANHGIESWERGKSAVSDEAQSFTRQIKRLARSGKSLQALRPGIRFEDKTYSLAIHYRQAIDPGAARSSIMEFLETTSEARGLDIREGKMVVEARVPQGSNKGTVLRSVVESHGIKSVLVLGDDVTDIDSFRMLDQLRQENLVNGFSVAIPGTGAPSELLDAADFQLADTESVEIFLSWMAAEVAQT